jgi:TetR/AcrR family transcriptional repressor of mexJK operon
LAAKPKAKRPRKPPARRGGGGRPTRAAAEQLGAKILDVAAELFLTEGYGVTSIDAIARRARIAKRTLYSRYRDKAELFGAVVHQLIDRLRPGDDAALFDGGTLEEILTRLAQFILQAALSPPSLALHRIILAEAIRFPELATVASEQGGNREAVSRIGALLEREAAPGKLSRHDTAFAAAQFLQMVVGLPQRRAMGLGTPMTRSELDGWTRDTVAFFLTGLQGRLQPPK